MSRPGIGGAGCALLDILYPDARIESAAFDRYRSHADGDGGLVPGQLVFASALEAYTGAPVDRIISEICTGTPPSSNLGGPAIVALVLAAQLLADRSIPVRYFGARGDDAIGDTIWRIASQTPLDISAFHRRHGESPSTKVLSDPSAAGGSGERTFINDLGVAADFRVGDLPSALYEYEIVYFGGTALVPRLHAELGAGLRRAKRAGALTVVTTVYDFFNQSRAPEALWPLGDGQGDYRFIDLLIVDAEEARRLSGETEPARAIQRFFAWGAGAAIVTAGSEPVWYGVSSHADAAPRFAPTPIAALPVSAEVRARAPSVDPSSHDTTGCGDNFAGGVLASLATQLDGARAAVESPPTGGGSATLDLREAVIEGIAAGAAAWFQLGGVRIEATPGEVRARVADFRAAYRRQIATA